MAKRATVLLGGGVGSALALTQTVVTGMHVDAIHVQYGQPYATSNRARLLAQIFDVPLLMIRVEAGVKHDDPAVRTLHGLVGGIVSFEPRDVIVDRTAKLERLAAENDERAAKKLGPIREEDFEKRVDLVERESWVPFRMLTVLAIGANHAVRMGSKGLVVGVTRDDAGRYPDTSDPAMSAAVNALQVAQGAGGVAPAIVAPLIVRTLAENLDALFHAAENPIGEREEGEPDRLADLRDALAVSRSCHRDEVNSCGRCVGCTVRGKAFAAIGRADPAGIREWSDRVKGLAGGLVS